MWSDFHLQSDLHMETNLCQTQLLQENKFGHVISTDSKWQTEPDLHNANEPVSDSRLERAYSKRRSVECVPVFVDR